MPQDDQADRSVPAVDARLWGKEKGLLAPYPVICHLIDTAAIAGALWDAWVEGIAVLRDGAGTEVPSDSEMRKLVCFWAGLHDLGKVSPSFQVSVADLYQQLLREAPEYAGEANKPVAGLRHNEVTQWVLVEILRSLGYPGDTSFRLSVAHQIAQLLGGHHGRFCPALSRAELRNPQRDGVGKGAWRQQCEAHAQVLQELTGAYEPLGERLAIPAGVVVLGIVIVADWLASQEEFISARLPAPGWRATQAEVRAHWERAVAEAPDVVRAAGLGRARFGERSFSELFPFEPNALQASVAKNLPSLVRGPGLLLVTAPPGDGKTEVALYAATVLARACGVGGLGFCLPTMATTDAMHKRVAEFASRALLGDAALTRVHSMAWLSQDAAADAAGSAADAGAVVSDPEASVEAAQWLHSSRRGLLAPLSTFTIDQALTGVLPVKYNMLRLLGLAGKVVVVDEAHAYDVWMHALLVRLLEWLGALKVPVVLLSATLTGSSARSLVDAYLRGSGHDDGGQVRPCYPGWLFADAVTGEVCEPREVPSERERDLTFDVVPVRRGEDSSRSGHRIAVIQELLEPVVRGDRGCVLVCCTTVKEAQETYTELAAWFSRLRDAGERPPELRLLHSRFRARDRAAITDGCEADFGKTGARPRTVLVSTQIIEQSLDLDFDLLITDLAPMALLLQRAGRCQRHRGRHHDLHRELRPDWIGADPRIVVLDPVNADGTFEVPGCWGDVYDESLLHRTSRLLHDRCDAPIAVPGAVQELVDAVYAADFARVVEMDEATKAKLWRADGERLADQAAQLQLSKLAKIKPPDNWLLNDLWNMSNAEAGTDPSLVKTRLSPDSARLVCAYEQEPGRWTLDEQGEIPVPGIRGVAKVSAADARLIAHHMIPVRGAWIEGDTELLPTPRAWEANSVLADWSLLPMRLDPAGRWRGRVRSGPVEYGESAGLDLSTPSVLGSDSRGVRIHHSRPPRVRPPLAQGLVAEPPQGCP
ncbi:CRISPR-associated helicase Cas3' [Actinomadura sp. NEAU-AAG7]|uniref:CRISPR-associated helicase Cas3' n=1 Tax=Actinomadura sp. NEAU-AAG7 TaxID=2839640 RepID=UPI001BE48EBB|nr:CRISPR-associated helicase Cas3' [Actinomadura sp. NEAU-AAG7]MBT2207272.1 CRISPR-associated helicase Cas3' [Actinomadura sp. NEAU-AAG7]